MNEYLIQKIAESVAVSLDNEELAILVGLGKCKGRTEFTAREWEQSLRDALQSWSGEEM